MSTSVDTALERNPGRPDSYPSPRDVHRGWGLVAGAGPSRTPTSFLSRARARTREG
jgi:hypothetical protein